MSNKWKQKVIDDYLASSGRNQFVPAEFLGWLKEQPEHECYEVFFGISDAEAAFAYREDLVRRWVSGLRIVVKHEDAHVKNVGTIEVSEYSLPLAHSPVENRRDGGGYVRTDPNDPEHLAELARQGAVALASWIERYRGTANLLGIEVEGLEQVRLKLDTSAEKIKPKVLAA